MDSLSWLVLLIGVSGIVGTWVIGFSLMPKGAVTIGILLSTIAFIIAIEKKNFRGLFIMAFVMTIAAFLHWLVHSLGIGDAVVVPGDPFSGPFIQRGLQGVAWMATFVGGVFGIGLPLSRE